MEEINILELLKYFWNKKFIILLITLLFTICGAFYIRYMITPMYNSSTTVILVNQSDESKTYSESNSELNLNKQLVSTYSEIIKNSSVLETVIDNLNLYMTTKELSKMIDVSSVNNTEIIKIEVKNADNLLARNIVSEVTDTFIEKVNTIYQLKNVTILNEPKIEELPYNINYVKQITISFLIGLFISLLICFIIFYFDNTIKSSSDIEALDLLVLGSIAKVGEYDEV